MTKSKQLTGYYTNLLNKVDDSIKEIMDHTIKQDKLNKSTAIFCIMYSGKYVLVWVDKK